MFNVMRPIKAPDSLQSRTKYDKKDVYDELKNIFFSKCYLCESKEPQDINVEHFHAHMEDLNKKFDWNNLYLACSRCNNIKLAEFDDLLDCCDVNIDVFRAIKHLPPRTPYSKKVNLEAMNADQRTTQTTALLDKIFNSEHTVNKQITGSFLRHKVFDQYNLLLDQINEYYSPTATEKNKESALSKIEVLIKRSSAYSAFIRWCVFEDENLGPLLIELMD